MPFESKKPGPSGLVWNAETMKMTKILLIEDDVQMRSMLSEVLQRNNFDVYEAQDGKIGEEICKKVDFDLVITDIIMPNQEGLETIMILRHYHPKLKIIAMSGGGSAGPDVFLEMASELGADKMLAKPFMQKELLAAIKEVLGEDKSPG